MEWLIDTDMGRTILLILSGVGFLLQLDNFFESLNARKGGDNPSEEEPSPPSD